MALWLRQPHHTATRSASNQPATNNHQQPANQAATPRHQASNHHQAGRQASARARTSRRAGETYNLTLNCWRQKKFFCGGEPVRVTVLQFCFDKKKSCFFATPAIWRQIVSRTRRRANRTTARQRRRPATPSIKKNKCARVFPY